MLELASPIGVLIILVLLSAVGFSLLLLNKLGSVSRQVADLEAYLHNLEKQADHNSGVLFRVADTTEQLRLANEESVATLDSLRRDIGHLSDDVRGELGTSRAIEMARSGVSKEDIAAKTGIPIQEVEAIVTFHGKSKKK